MKKRIMGLLLSGVMASALVLAGCGGNNGANETEPAASTSSSAAAKEEAEKEADGVEVTEEEVKEATEEAAEEAAAEVIEPVDVEARTLTFTTTFSENEYAGQLITHLDEELQNLTNGAVNLEVYWGGTMAGTGEELDFVGQGGVDMSLIGQSQYTNVLSLLNFPSQVLGGYADSVALIDDIAFNNPATKDAVQAEIEANNVVMLGSMPGGSNSFITKQEYKSLDEMQGLKIGIGMNQSAMEMLGFNVVSMMPWDYYDQLSRSVADAGYMSTAGLVSMSMQEVTPYFLTDGTYTAGNLVTINLDTWNSMDETTQEVFRQAVANTQDFACDLVKTMDEEAANTIVEAGGALNTVGAEDAAKIQEAFFTTGVADARAFAEAAGTSEAMETILEEVGKTIGLEVPAA